MDKLKNFSMLLLAVLIACPLYADDADKILIDAGSKSKLYAVSDIRRIEFNESDICVVETTENGTVYAFEEIRKIVFNPSETDAIESVAMSSQRENISLFVSSDGNSITVRGWDSTRTVSAELYNVSGKRLLSQKRWSGESISISNLPTGVYIIKVGKHTAKFRK